MSDNEFICPICGEVVNLEKDDFTEYDNEYYHNDCFDNNFSYCEDCSEYYPNDEVTYLDNYDKSVCDTCLDRYYYRCEACDEWLYEDDVYWGADDYPYCKHCWNERFTTCDECGETIWRDDSYYDDEGYCTYCEACYHNKCDVIYSYHNSEVEYIPKYLDDEDRNKNYEQLYGLELEITGDKSTSREFQKIMRDNVVLMRDSSVDGYEMVSMPLSRQYFYKEFVPLLDKGLKYLRDNGCTGHNGGGIHIHFKELECGLEVANMVNILYGSEDDINIWLAISQRRKSAMENWCSMNTLYNSPESIIEDRLLSPNGSDNHSTALNYDDRTGTHELRIFNSNLRLERVIKNMECLFALEDYVRQQIGFVCTTSGFIDFVYHNKTKYPYLYNFMIEKNIFDKAYEYYNTIYVLEMIYTTETLEV